MKKSYIALTVAVLLALTVALAAGCGKKSTTNDTSTQIVGPEMVTAFQAAELTKPAANKWEPNNWAITIRDGDMQGINKEGKSRIWEVYYFSPSPEVNSQMLVIYNRGNVWPNTPGPNRGGDSGRDTYRKEKPPEFRVDSGEAYTVSLRNGGGAFLDANKGSQANVVLRCKADYDAVSEKMPAPKYKWIWQVIYRVPTIGTDVLYISVDGMNGDFITKEERKPSS